MEKSLPKLSRAQKVKARLVRVIGDEGLDALLQDEYEAAQAGDADARRFILARTIAPLRAESAPRTFKLDLTNLASAARSILEAASTGKLPIDQAKTLLESLNSTGQIGTLQGMNQKVADIAARLAQQEAAGAPRVPKVMLAHNADLRAAQEMVDSGEVTHPTSAEVIDIQQQARWDD